MTKKELQELYWIKRNIQYLENKLIELESEATRVTTRLSLTPKGSGKNADKLSEVVCRIVTVQNQINDMLSQSYEFMARIERAIERLPPREGFLIRLRYLELKSWESICVEMNYQWAQVHRIHSDALKLLA